MQYSAHVVVVVLNLLHQFVAVLFLLPLLLLLGSSFTYSIIWTSHP